MKKLFYSLAIIAAVTACNEEMKESDSPVNGEGKTFTAKFEGSKVYMGEDYYYRWQEGDLVSVFTGSEHDQYKATTGDVTETELEFVSKTADLDAAVSESYAVYPYDKAATIADGVVYTNLAAEQTYSENGLGNAIMVSKTTGSDFVFKNACALVKVNLKIAEDFTNLHAVKSIRVSSKSKPLSGAATINVAGGDYAAKMATQTLAAENAVTLVGCEEAGLLQADEALTFYLAIPAGTYEAGDLTVSVLTNTQSTPFNQAFTLTKNYTVNRSQYIEVTATIAKDYEWFTGDEEEVVIKEDVTLVNKAIMAYIDNLLRQGFGDQSNIETIFDVPYKDMVIRGESLYGEGAFEGEDGKPTITFVTTDDEAFIMNTFTSFKSGLSDVATPPTITVDNLRITGELRTNTIGIYVDNVNWKDQAYNQGKFNTVWNGVDVVDCQIMPYADNEKVKIGAAVCVYGTVELNNCKITGSVWDERATSIDDISLYDVACTNSTKVFVNGGEIGSIHGWEQSQITFDGGAHVDYAHAINISAKDSWKWTVKNATIDVFEVDPHTTYKPNVTITAEATVGTLIFKDDRENAYNSEFWTKVSIDANATIGEIYVGDTKYDLAGFLAFKASVK